MKVLCSAALSIKSKPRFLATEFSLQASCQQYNFEVVLKKSCVLNRLESVKMQEQICYKLSINTRDYFATLGISHILDLY